MYIEHCIAYIARLNVHSIENEEHSDHIQHRWHWHVDIHSVHVLPWHEEGQGDDNIDMVNEER